ncbi:Carnosine synthase 1 [Perkinsus olseni]|uniref:Carnosine synthase 1 n=1 Tax=Perkinsus olseni TaxID=32597 RepID=A0A7J6NXA4_PEROL|nr:Carnosine synthase 1 [Perkinsus olseni]
MKTEFEEAQKVAANRPRAGTWESPHARPLTAYPSTHELNDFALDGASTDPDRGVGLDNPFLAGQFFQTSNLPDSMTSEERAKLAQSLAPTATYEMLSKIPSDLVEMETPEGQDLRQRLLRGATVVFFCAGYPALLLGLRVSSGALEQVAENDNASDDEASEGVNANEVISLDMVLEEYLDGVIKDLGFIERHEESSHVLQLEPLVKPGEHVVGPAEGMPTWLAEIVIKDESSEKARDECQRLMKVIAEECAESLV